MYLRNYLRQRQHLSLLGQCTVRCRYLSAPLPVPSGPVQWYEPNCSTITPVPSGPVYYVEPNYAKQITGYQNARPFDNTCPFWASVLGNYLPRDKWSGPRNRSLYHVAAARTTTCPFWASVFARLAKVFYYSEMMRLLPPPRFPGKYIRLNNELNDQSIIRPKLVWVTVTGVCVLKIRMNNHWFLVIK